MRLRTQTNFMREMRPLLRVARLTSNAGVYQTMRTAASQRNEVIKRGLRTLQFFLAEIAHQTGVVFCAGTSDLTVRRVLSVLVVLLTRFAPRAGVSRVLSSLSNVELRKRLFNSAFITGFVSRVHESILPRNARMVLVYGV